MEILDVVIVLLAGLIGYSIAGVAGFGGGVMLLPVLTATIGPYAAMPTLCFASIMATSSRVWINRRYIDWKVTIYFFVGAIPFTILGTYIFISLDQSTIKRTLGVFVLIILLSKLLPLTKHFHMKLWAFTPLGAVTAFIAGVVGVPGPFTSIFFLNYGLTKLAFIGTFALAMGALNLPKLFVFSTNGFITKEIVYLGIAIGTIGCIASYFGSRIVGKLKDKYFAIFIISVLFVFALYFIVIG